MINNASASDPRAPIRFVPIAELARRLGVTPRTLRHYQDQGLIRSHRVAHNARAYDPEAVAIVETIVALRDIDLPIATIRDILALRREPRAQAEALRAALAEVRADKHRQIAEIDAMLQALTVWAPVAAAPQIKDAVPAPWRLTGRASRFDGMATRDAG